MTKRETKLDRRLSRACRLAARLGALLGLAGVGLLVLALAASASTETFSGSVPLTSTNWSTSVSVTKFDPALGNLQSVQCSLAGHVEGTVSIENLQAGVSNPISTQLSALLTLRRPAGATILTTAPTHSQTDTVGPFDGAADFAGPDSLSFNSSADQTSSATMTSGPDLALFTGPSGAPGSIALPIAATAQSSASGSGNLQSRFLTQASAVVNCTYSYFAHPVANNDSATTAQGTPVAINVLANDTSPDSPLDPGSVTVTGAPAHGTTSVNPANGVVTYTPTSGFMGADSFTYRVCDSESPTPQCASAAVTVTVAPPADLAISKAANGAFTSGANASYTITVSNTGGAATSGTVTVTETLPAGETFVSATGTGWTCAFSSGTVGCSTAAPIAAGGTAPPITLTVNVTAANGATITNTATVGPSDATPADNTASATVTVGAPADLAITKAGPATVAAGARLTYTLTVTNNGPSTAVSVSVSDALPAALGSPTTSTPGCSIAGTTLSCSFASLANGASQTITVSGTAPASGTLTNQASVTSATADPNPANNTSAVVTTTVTPQADVSIVKTHADPLVVGQNGTYTLSVANAGPSASGALTLTDTLPAGLSFVSGTGTGWTCSVAGQAVTCSNPNGLDSGASSTLTLVVGVGPAASPSVTNTASVTGTTPDPNPANNSASDPTNVTPVADLAITKTGPVTVAAGGTVTYTLTVANSGPSTATSVSVSDALPAALRSPTTSTPGCSIAASTLTCSFASLGSGASQTITVSGTAPASGTLTNRASVTSATADPNPANNTSAGLTTTVTPVSVLTLTKTGPTTAGTGDNVTYRLTVTNEGPSASGSLTITDTLPAALTYVTSSGVGWTCSPSGQVVSCVNSSGLDAGAASTLSLTSRVNAGSSGSVVNRATVAGSSGSASVTGATAVEALELTASPSPAPSGRLAATGAVAGGVPTERLFGLGVLAVLLGWVLLASVGWRPRHSRRAPG